MQLTHIYLTKICAIFGYILLYFPSWSCISCPECRLKPIPPEARSAADRWLGLWVRITPGAWMSVSCKCCVLSGRGLCVGLITRPEESYRLWCVVVCDLETSKKRRPWPALGRSATGRENKRSLKVATLASVLFSFLRLSCPTETKETRRRSVSSDSHSVTYEQSLFSQKCKSSEVGQSSLCSKTPSGNRARRAVKATKFMPNSVAKIEYLTTKQGVSESWILSSSTNIQSAGDMNCSLIHTTQKVFL